MLKIITSILFVITTVFISNAQESSDITIQNAAEHIGTETTICDLVADVYRPEGENKMVYINFGGKYPDNTFSAIIFPKDQAYFKYDPVIELANKHICVTGTITEYKGKPQMVVKVPTQINVQE